MPFISFPTGRESDFLGDQGVTGEGRLIVEGRPIDPLLLSFNIAFKTREKVEIADFSFRDVLIFALGLNWRMVDDVALIAEVESQTATSDFYGSQRTSPAEARLGVRWNPGGGNWEFGGGASGGLVHGAGMPRVAGFLNVRYRNRIKRDPMFTPDIFAELGEQEDCMMLSVDDGTASNRYRVMCSTYFGFDEATAHDHRVILGIIDLVKKAQRTVQIEIRGWTDTTGNVHYNDKLSFERAEYIAAAIRRGLGEDVNKARIRVIGAGEDRVSPAEKARRTDSLLK
jgi:hypothetical protein